MRRSTLNLLIDFATLVAMLGMIGTGLLNRFVLPPGTGGRLSLWGWDRHDWGDLHFWLAALLVAILILHVALHWDWVCATVRRRVLREAATRPALTFRRRALIGVGFVTVLAVAVGAFLWLALRSVDRAQDEDRRGRGQRVHLYDHADSLVFHS